jgi:DNA polymerase I
MTVIVETDYEDRIETFEAPSVVFKWILVCFLATTATRARTSTGLIAHEAIHVYTRNGLPIANEYIENGGWWVVSGIVDSISVQLIDGVE